MVPLYHAFKTGIGSERGGLLKNNKKHPGNSGGESNRRTMLTQILSVVPLQLFAYYAAKARGCGVDKPRNLAKCAKVE